MFRDYQNYDVQPDGRIWSKKYKKFLKPQTRKDGYQQVCLTDNNGKLHSEKVHKIIYFAVNGLLEYPKGYEINHKDENKENNHISNLELVTRKENLNWGSYKERMAKAMKGNTNSPQKRVGAFNENGELVMAFPSIMEAQRNGYNQGAVSACCRNCYMSESNNKYKGFEWRYLEE